MFFFFSVSLLLTTTEATVVELPEAKRALASRLPQGQMGGMGGMGF